MPCSDFLWSVFSRIQAEYGKILNIFSYSVQMLENMDKKNYEYGHFSRSAKDGDLKKPEAYSKNCQLFTMQLSNYFRGKVLNTSIL